MVSREHYSLGREELVRTLTSRRGVTTADGNAGGTTLFDSQLVGENDFLTGKSILILDGDAQFETAGISSFDTTNGEITVATGFSTQIVAGVSYRVLNTLPESVHVTSGAVQIQGYDYASAEYRLVSVNESGQIDIVATIADIVTARISGQSVVVTSGQVVGKISGETIIASVSGAAVSISGETVIAEISGDTIIGKISGDTVIAKISGDTIIGKISGDTIIAKISGDVVKISGEAVEVSGATVIAKISGDTIIGKVSGETIITSVSGDTIITSVSGDIIVAKVSGETIVAKVSGESILISSGETVIAQVSGEVVKISGETVEIATPDTNKTMGLRMLTDLSGGEVLHSGAINAAIVKALSGNSGDVFVGGATDRPYSGFGFLLEAGESYSQDAQNFDQIYLVATVSGDQVTGLGTN